MDVSVIMINYNTFALAKDAVDSIFACTKGVDYEVILVDNLSPDGSGERLSAVFGDKIVYIGAGGNLGTSKAFNLGLSRATGKYILWLNPDILLRDNFIGTLFSYMEAHPDCGICGGNVLDFEGRPAHSFRMRAVSPAQDRRDKSLICALFKKLFCRPFAGEYNYKDKPVEVGYVTGADMMVRRSLFDAVGGFDEDIFMYAEEVEFTFRAVKATGCKVVCVPDAHILHLEGASFGKETRFNERRFRSGMTGAAKCHAKCLGEGAALAFLKLQRRSYQKFALLCALTLQRERRAVYRTKFAIADEAVKQFPAILESEQR